MPRRKKDMVEETGHMDPEAFIKAVKDITKEKGISEDVVFEAMELALATAYKKNFNSKTNVKVLFDRETGEIKVYSFLTIFIKNVSLNIIALNNTNNNIIIEII